MDHLITIADLSDDDISALMTEAQRLFDKERDGDRHDRPLTGKTVINAFYENSTRTLLSFTIAAQRLGADAVTMQVEMSSVKKGETLDDTARTLNAMRPDLLVMRHGDNDAPHRVAKLMDCPVINGGNGTGEHPTQALLDAATIQRHFGRIEGLTVTIAGDIKHSRVARSNAALLRRLGANVRLAGPEELLPEDHAPLSLDDAVEGADVVMMLRVQRERLEKTLDDAPGEFLRLHGLTKERFARASDQAVIMHPGPMNRGVEIEGELADHPDRSLITTQVEMGVAMRMAIMDRLIGG